MHLQPKKYVVTKEEGVPPSQRINKEIIQVRCSDSDKITSPRKRKGQQVIEMSY